MTLHRWRVAKIQEAQPSHHQQSKHASTTFETGKHQCQPPKLTGVIQNQHPAGFVAGNAGRHLAEPLRIAWGWGGGGVEGFEGYVRPPQTQRRVAWGPRAAG